MKELKKQLRKAINVRKKECSLQMREEYATRIWEVLEHHPRFVEASTVLLYHSLTDEVATHAFVERWCEKKTILLPVVRGEDLELHPYTGKECLCKGAFGIEEPVTPRFTALEKIELAVIPGVSFDKKGNRLGRGKGYYDRLLPQLNSYNIGVCFAFQASEEVPHEDFDRKMDAVLTDEGWLLG